MATICIAVLLVCLILIERVLLKSFAQTTIYSQINSNLIHIFFGKNETERTTVGIALNSQFSWIFELKKNNSSFTESNVIREYIEFFYDNYSYIGKEIEDSCYIRENKNKPMICRFYLIKEKTALYSTPTAGIALPFVFSDYSHSIIHSLLNLGHIEELAFSVVRDVHSGRFYFGGMPETEKENKTEAYCEVLGRSFHWDCLISKVTIESPKEVYQFIPDETSNYAYFDLLNDYSFVPRDFFEGIINNIFSKEIAEQTCIIHSNEIKRSLICLGYYYSGSGTFIMTIGDYSYSIPFNRLWDCDEEICLLTLYEKRFSSNWVIGNNILKRYDLLFDYQRRRVSFFATQGIQNQSIRDKESKTIQLIILIPNVLLLIFGIGVIGYKKYISIFI